MSYTFVQINRTLPRVNSKINCSLGDYDILILINVMILINVKFILGNKYTTLVNDIDNRLGYAHVGIWDV